MGSLNKVMLIGRLGTEVEKRVTQGGSSVANFSLATSEKYKDPQGKWQEKTEWHRIAAWNKQADLAENFLSKGRQVFIEGKNQTSEWTDKDGNKRFQTEVVVNFFQFIDPKDSSNGQANQNHAKPAQQRNRNYDHRNGNPLPGDQNQANDDDFIEDDIPF